MSESPFDDMQEFEDSYDETVNCAKKQRRWEDRVVKTIMFKGGYRENYHQLCRERKEITDKTDGLSLDIFHMFAGDTFPVYLTAKRIPYLYKLTHEQIWKGLKQVTNEFFDAHDQVPSNWLGKPVGLVFEWLHSAGQMKIIHTYTGNTEVTGMQLRWPAHKWGTPRRRPLLTMENLDDFLKNCNWIKAEE